MTIIILGITVLISVAGFYNRGIIDKLILNPYLIREKKQWYRFITSGFLHADFIHLAVNMYVLYIFGPAVERFYMRSFGSNASLIYVLLYLSSILASNASTYYKHKKDPNYNSLGASGAVSAILFAFILYAPYQPLTLYFVIELPGIVIAIGYLVYSYYMNKKQSDNINHQAHFDGAIYGIAYTIALKPSVFGHFINQLMNF